MDMTCYPLYQKLISRAHAILSFSSKEKSLSLSPTMGNKIYINKTLHAFPSAQLLQVGDQFSLLKLESGSSNANVVDGDRYLFTYEVREISLGGKRAVEDIQSSSSSSFSSSSISGVERSPAKKRKPLPLHHVDGSLYECSFCYEVLALSHVCSCGTSLCYICIRDIAQNKSQAKCIICKKPWRKPSDVVPNLALDNIIAAVVASSNKSHLIDDLKARVKGAREQKKIDEDNKAFVGPSRPIQRVSAPPEVLEIAEGNKPTLTPPDLKPNRPSSAPVPVISLLDDDTMVRGSTRLEADSCFEFKHLAVGAANSSLNTCVHCNALILKQTLRIIFQDTFGSFICLHFDCIKAFNDARKKEAKPTFPYHMIEGRWNLKDEQRELLKRAIRS